MKIENKVYEYTCEAAVDAVQAVRPANTTKHTPGPWHTMPFGKDSQTGNPGETIYGADNIRIAEIQFTPRKASLTKGRELAEHEANARLIAAAPEMLEALVMLMHDVDHPERGVPGHRHAVSLASRQLALTAISKAQ